MNVQSFNFTQKTHLAPLNCAVFFLYQFPAKFNVFSLCRQRTNSHANKVHIVDDCMCQKHLVGKIEGEDIVNADMHLCIHKLSKGAYFLGPVDLFQQLHRCCISLLQMKTYQGQRAWHWNREPVVIFNPLAEFTRNFHMLQKEGVLG